MVCLNVFNNIVRHAFGRVNKVLFVSEVKNRIIKKSGSARMSLGYFLYFFELINDLNE